MSLLPKSIHRCRRYPTKFNSGRDIPQPSVDTFITKRPDEPVLSSFVFLDTTRSMLVMCGQAPVRTIAWPRRLLSRDLIDRSTVAYAVSERCQLALPVSSELSVQHLLGLVADVLGERPLRHEVSSRPVPMCGCGWAVGVI